MKIRQKIAQWIGGAVKGMSFVSDSISLSFVDISTINQQAAIEFYQSNAEFRALIGRIASMCERIPIRLNRRTYSMENGVRVEKIEEVAEHPILQVLARPNDYESEADFRNKEITNQLVCGNSYIWGVTVGRNVKMMHVLPSAQIKMKRDSLFSPVSGYILELYGQMQNIPAEEVVSRREGNINAASAGWQYGKSPIMCAPMLVERINAVSLSAAMTIRNGGARGMLVGDNAPGVDYDEDGMKSLKDNWRDAGTGPKNAGKIVISSHKFSYLKIGDSVVDMQLIDMEKANRVALANLYQFPVQLLNSEEASTDNNYATARKQAITDAVLPQVQGYCDSLNRLLVASYGDATLFLAPDISELEELQEDYKMKAEWVSKIKDVLTPNEVREAFKYGKIDSEEADITIWERDALSNPAPAPVPNPTRL